MGIKSKKYNHFETNAVRTQVDRSQEREHSVPIYATSSFVFDSADHARAVFAEEEQGNIYSRFSNPNNDEFISKLCLLEGAEDGISTASGMAAVFLIFISFLKKGDHILASRSLFGSSHQVITQILPKWGIEYTYVDAGLPEDWERNIKPNTKLLYAETPSNPGLDILDLEYLGKLAKAHNLVFAIDNCFATPYLQNPLKFGAHLVAHSATKFIDGQGRTIGGAVVGDLELIKEIRFMARQTGPAMSPFNGWILSKSLETLAVRMERHCENAQKLAEYLDQHKEIKWIKYPFLPSFNQYEIAKKQMRLGGGLVTFELNGGLERAKRFLDNIQMFSLTANLGDSRTAITHPASTTHSKLSSEDKQAVGITDGLIRICAGLEHIDDIIGDVEQAIAKSK